MGAPVAQRREGAGAMGEGRGSCREMRLLSRVKRASFRLGQALSCRRRVWNVGTEQSSRGALEKPGAGSWGWRRRGLRRTRA